jgi:lipid-A-disaccharide synthase
MRRLLVVAGEGSGDALASPVVARLGVPAFGMGGPLLQAAGADLVADLRDFAAMGVGGVLARGPSLAHAVLRLVLSLARERPRAALLVGFSEVNAILARRLRESGTRVLWYAPPQVWAWRRGRAATLARRADRMAVVLPFEAAVWRRAGAQAEYVGHPALETTTPLAGRTPDGHVALLPGSRAHEVRAHLEPMLSAAKRLAPLRAEVVRAAALDDATRRWVAERAIGAGVAVSDGPLARSLSGARAALVASGTATLECAVMGVPPVIVYRTDPVTYAVAKRLVRAPHVGLPNLVLGRPAFPELLQHDVRAEVLAATLGRVLDAATHYEALCAETRRALLAGLHGDAPSVRVAAILEPWLT